MKMTIEQEQKLCSYLRITTNDLFNTVFDIWETGGKYPQKKFAENTPLKDRVLWTMKYNLRYIPEYSMPHEKENEDGDTFDIINSIKKDVLLALYVAKKENSPAGVNEIQFLFWKEAVRRNKKLRKFIPLIKYKGDTVDTYDPF